ncbi:hypothetical protein Syun_030743 [Stephania yunnanensis]|uniref:Uncharacterized protein n=1 Tax=Stephania yunnanensis TaxID=152371 RepID=A0AAP0DVT4_9MAGN
MVDLGVLRASACSFGAYGPVWCDKRRGGIAVGSSVSHVVQWVHVGSMWSDHKKGLLVVRLNYGGLVPLSSYFRVRRQVFSISDQKGVKIRADDDRRSVGHKGEHKLGENRERIVLVKKEERKGLLVSFKFSTSSVENLNATATHRVLAWLFFDLCDCASEETASVHYQQTVSLPRTRGCWDQKKAEGERVKPSKWPGVPEDSGGSMEDGCMWLWCGHAAARAKADLGTNLSTGIGGLRYEPWHGHRRTKVRALARAHADLGHALARARHALARARHALARGLTNLDLGFDPGRNALGWHGHGSKEDPRACLGHHAKARPSDPWFGHPAGGTRPEPRLTPSVLGTARHHQAVLSVEKHGPRPLRCGEPESSDSSGWVTTLVMAGGMTKERRKCLEHVAIDQAVEAVMGPVPTLPHLNLFLVVLGGHRSALQRTLDLLDIGTGVTATPKEKWFIYDGEENKVVEKYISLSIFAISLCGKNMLRMRKVYDKFAFATCEARLKDDTLDDPSPSSGVEGWCDQINILLYAILRSL